MNITLSQKEIEAAVRQFVAGQGIAITGKSMSIKFTTTRNPSSISAEIVLDESAAAAQIPGFTDRPADTTLALVGNTNVNSAADVTSEAKVATAPAAGTIGAAIADVISTTAEADKNAAPTDEVKTVPEDQAEVTAAAADTPAEPAPAAATTTSLFGG